MQKLYNFMSVFAFAVSAGIVAGGAYLYINKDDIAHHIHEDIARFATEAITEALPGMLNSSVPKVEAPVPEGLPVNPF